jgi:hypothetical protein
LRAVAANAPAVTAISPHTMCATSAVAKIGPASGDRQADDVTAEHHWPASW